MAQPNQILALNSLHVFASVVATLAMAQLQPLLFLHLASV
jgi:hypothetical protein